MPSKWALKQQRKLEEIGGEIGIDIKVSHLDKTQYLPEPVRKTGKREQIITYPDGLVRNKNKRIIGVVEIESAIDPKKLAGDIFATDAALVKEKQKHRRPFLVVAAKKIENDQKRKLNYILRYARKQCKCLVDIQLCPIGKLKNRIKKLLPRV